MSGFAAGYGLTQVAQSFLETAKQFENFKTQLTTITGSSYQAEQAMSWIKDFAKTTPYELKERYSQKIAMLLTYASTIPTLMDERQNRNFMQAFVYLATAKESLGIIRATLNQSFINDAFEQREQITIQESLKIYNTELERF